MGSAATLLERAQSFDADRAISATSGDIAGREVTTSALLSYIQKIYQVAFEAARDILNVLVQTGRAQISSFTTVRFVE